MFSHLQTHKIYLIPHSDLNITQKIRWPIMNEQKKIVSFVTQHFSLACQLRYWCLNIYIYISEINLDRLDETSNRLCIDWLSIFFCTRLWWIGLERFGTQRWFNCKIMIIHIHKLKYIRYWTLSTIFELRLITKNP